MSPNTRRRGSGSSSSSSVGSLNAIDTVDEDVSRNEESRASGYIRRNPEIAWMHRLGKQAAEKNDDDDLQPEVAVRQNQPPMSNMGSLTSVNYHLDDYRLSSREIIDPFYLPPRAVADQLFNTYMDSVDPSFPIIRKALFTAQYRQLSSGVTRGPGSKWLAILNLVFAIATKHCSGVSARDQK